jgi:hypothetical protein
MAGPPAGGTADNEAAGFAINGDDFNAPIFKANELFGQPVIVAKYVAFAWRQRVPFGLGHVD